MPVVGPGSVQEVATDVKPTLAGASEYEFVKIRNILTDDFAIRVAQDVPVNMPFNIGKDISGKTAQTTLSERDAAQTYGLSLKNPDFVGRKHIINDTIIPAGHTINLKGNEAQVAVKQLVDEVMQREGNTRLMSDPYLRQEVENRIIVSRGSIQDLMDNTVVTPRDQMTEAINRANEVQNEPSQGLDQPGQGTADQDSSQPAETAASDGRDESSPRRVGRPKKADS